MNALHLGRIGIQSDDATLGRHLLFAAQMAKGDPSLPRTLAAHQLVWDIPEDIGRRLVVATQGGGA